MGTPSLSRSIEKSTNFTFAFEFVLSLTRSKLSPGSKYCSFDSLVKLPNAEPISKTINPICTTRGPIFPIKPLLAEI